MKVMLMKVMEEVTKVMLMKMMEEMMEEMMAAAKKNNKNTNFS
jgi:phosphoribosyl-ATP pyrophosphohydrolase